MAQQIPVSLFYRKGGFSVGAVKFDLIMEEEHSMNASVTERAVQDGSSISDHVQNQLREGSMTGLISNWSLSQVLPERNLAFNRRLINSIALRGSEALTGLRPTFNRAQEAYDQLVQLYEAKVPVTIVTSVQVYKNVLVTSISTGRQADTGESLEFQISFRQVRIVKLKQKQLTTAVKPNPPAKGTANDKQAQPKVVLGNQTGTRP